MIALDPTPPDGTSAEPSAAATATTGTTDRTVVVAPRPHRSRVPVVISVIVVAGLLAVGAAFFTRSGSNTPGRSPTSPPSSTVATLRIANASAFDPLGRDGDEHNDEASRAIDGNAATFWETQDYADSHFGKLKDGVGLVLQLSGAATVHQLRVTTGTSGWSAQIYLSERPQTTLAAWGAPAAERASINGDATFDLGGKQAGAVLVWLTQLGSDGRAEINEAGVS
jgi:hypothetical protein